MFPEELDQKRINIVFAKDSGAYPNSFPAVKGTKPPPLDKMDTSEGTVGEGDATALGYCRALALAEKSEATIVKSEVDELKAKVEELEMELAVAKSAPIVAQGGTITPPSAEDLDARVLKVRWVGNRRRRRFVEAVELMEYISCPLKGEPTCAFVLDEMALSGLNATMRHQAWVDASKVPKGDRSVFEHFIISKVLELAAEVDQLNLPILASFEALVRRLQVIDMAHMADPSNPDYSHAEVFMGWDSTRGSAIIAPNQEKYAADKTRDKVAILTEQRCGRGSSITVHLPQHLSQAPAATSSDEEALPPVPSFPLANTVFSSSQHSSRCLF